MFLIMSVSLLVRTLDSLALISSKRFSILGDSVLFCLVSFSFDVINYVMLFWPAVSLSVFFFLLDVLPCLGTMGDSKSDESRRLASVTAPSLAVEE